MGTSTPWAEVKDEVVGIIHESLEHMESIVGDLKAAEVEVPESMTESVRTVKEVINGAHIYFANAIDASESLGDFWTDVYLLGVVDPKVQVELSHLEHMLDNHIKSVKRYRKTMNMR